MFTKKYVQLLELLFNHHVWLQTLYIDLCMNREAGMDRNRFELFDELDRVGQNSDTPPARESVGNTISASRISSLVRLNHSPSDPQSVLECLTSMSLCYFENASLVVKHLFNSHEQAYPLSIDFPLGICCSISNLVQHASRQ